MNNIHKAYFCLAIFIALSTFVQSNCMISTIANESENTITIAFMVWNLKKANQFSPAILDSECKEYKALNGPIELAPGETIIINSPIPQALGQISKEPAFEQTPYITPVYLQIRTKRRTQKKLRRSNDKLSCSPELVMYQDAIFNIILGAHNPNKKSLWAQKIVNGKVTNLQALSSPAQVVALSIDANGCPFVISSE